MVDGTRGRTRTHHGALVLVVATLLLAASCASSGTSTTTDTSQPLPSNDNVVEGTPVEGGKLVVAVTSETNGWNPATSQWADAGNFVGSTFLEPLFVFDHAGHPVPWLAESATPNADATAWTIKLRPGITFHDGTVLNAAAAVRSMTFSVSPPALAAIAIGSSIGEPYVVDDLTFVVPLHIPWGAFLSVLAGPSGYIMAPSMLAEDDHGTTAPVGTGAFEFESAVPDRFVRVNRFDDYWGGPCAVRDPAQDVQDLCAEAGVPLGQPNGPFLQSIEFQPLVDSLQRSQALETGDVDLILTTRARDVANLRSDYQVVTDYNSEQSFVMTSVSKAPFDNVHARRALAYGTDRAAIAELAGGGEVLQADTSPFEESSVWGGLAPENTGYPSYDPARAAAELELYRADTGQAGLTFTLTGLANTDDLEVMQALAEQWRELGITAEISTIKQEPLITLLVGGTSQATYYRNYAYPDPDSNYVFWSRSTAIGPVIINFSQFANDATESALQLGRASQDPAVRQQAYEQLVRERNDQAVDIWLFNTPYALIGNENIRGLNWFRQIGFGNFLPKPYLSGLWLAPKQ